MDEDREFLSTFNECYPLERYIFKTPKSLGLTFDDVLLTEFFVPYTEIKPVLNDTGSLSYFTHVNEDEVYIKVKGLAGEMRFGYMDFNENIREQIRWIFIEDFGEYNYESLYVDHEDDDNSELRVLLKEQVQLIKEKYGDCKIKKALRDNLIKEEPEIDIPKTVEEAINILDNILSKEDKEYIFKKGVFAVHHTLGRWIRNNWGLWVEEPNELKNNLIKLGFEHPDDMSHHIIEEYVKKYNK